MKVRPKNGKKKEGKSDKGETPKPKFQQSNAKNRPCIARTIFLKSYTATSFEFSGFFCPK